MSMNEDIDTPPTGEALISAIYRVSHRIMRLYSDAVFRQTGLNFQDWRILQAVVSLQTCRAQDICDECGLQKPHISNGLARLEKAGHIARRRNPDSRRGFLVVSTEQGSSLVESAGPALADLDKRLASSSGAEAGQQVLKELAHYQEELDRLASDTPAGHVTR